MGQCSAPSRKGRVRQHLRRHRKPDILRRWCSNPDPRGSIPMNVCGDECGGSTQQLAAHEYRQTSCWARRTRDRCLDYQLRVEPVQQNCVRSTTPIILFSLQLCPHVDLHENCNRLRLRNPNQITNLPAWGSRPVLSNVVSGINCTMPYVVRWTIANGQVAFTIRESGSRAGSNLPRRCCLHAVSLALVSQFKRL
jgi:hypothetical protein